MSAIQKHLIQLNILFQGSLKVKEIYPIHKLKVWTIKNLE